MRRLIVLAVLALLVRPALAQHPPIDEETKLRRARYEARAKIVDALMKDWSPDEYMRYADVLKSEDRYDEAAVFYLVALKMKPNFPECAYQLACDFSLWRSKEYAMKYFKFAVETGFWGWELVKTDTDLDFIRKEPGFDALAQKVKARYDEEAPKHDGGVLAKLPAGEPPEKGWPTLVLLAGWGSRTESLAELAEVSAARGLATIVIAGPVVMSEKSWRWPTDSIEGTHEHVQKVLAARTEKLDRSRVFVGGFSQGALHAALLAGTKPESYPGGAFVVSAEGTFEFPQKLPAPDKVGKLYILTGQREHPKNKELATVIEDAWIAGKRPTKAEHHLEGHQFPTDWKDRFKKALDWLLAPP